MTDDLDEEHMVTVRFRDPRDKHHGVSTNYSRRFRISRSKNKDHAESKLALHLARGGYQITSMKTKVVKSKKAEKAAVKKKKLKESVMDKDINEIAGMNYHKHMYQGSGDDKNGIIWSKSHNDVRKNNPAHRPFFAGGQIGDNMKKNASNVNVRSARGRLKLVKEASAAAIAIAKLHNKKAAVSTDKLVTDYHKNGNAIHVYPTKPMDDSLRLKKKWSGSGAGGSSKNHANASVMHDPNSVTQAKIHAKNYGKGLAGIAYATRTLNKEELEMDEPLNTKRRATAKRLDSIIDPPLKQATDYLGNTEDERRIRKWYTDNTRKVADRNGNGDDVFSATKIKRAHPHIVPGSDDDKYNASQQNMAAEARVWGPKEKAFDKLGMTNSLETHGDELHIRTRVFSGAKTVETAARHSKVLTDHGIAHQVISHESLSDKKGPLHLTKIKLK